MPLGKDGLFMSRKSNGDGSLRKKREGLWEYRVVVGYDNNQNPIRKSFYGKTKTEPKSKYRDWLKQAGQPQIEKVTTLGEWAAQWLEIYKKGKGGGRHLSKLCPLCEQAYRTRSRTSQI